MIEVNESIALDAPTERVWPIVGDFAGLHLWHPAVERTELTSEADVPVRHLHLSGGGLLVERQDMAASGAHRLAWTILSGPFPVSDYAASVTVEPLGSGSRVTWAARFAAAGMGDAEVRDIIAGAFRAGLDQLPGLTR